MSDTELKPKYLHYTPATPHRLHGMSLGTAMLVAGFAAQFIQQATPSLKQLFPKQSWIPPLLDLIGGGILLFIRLGDISRPVQLSPESVQPASSQPASFSEEKTVPTPIPTPIPTNTGGSIDGS